MVSPGSFVACPPECGQNYYYNHWRDDEENTNEYANLSNDITPEHGSGGFRCTSNNPSPKWRSGITWIKWNSKWNFNNVVGKNIWVM